MLKCVKAPEHPRGTLPRPYVFLAGGIPARHDWQAELSRLLRRKLKRGTIFNPRRSARYAQATDRTKAAQIAWEFHNLWRTDVIAFWFCKPSENATTLFEFGSHLMRRHCSANGEPAIVVGIEPGYTKEHDLRTQARLLDPHMKFVNTLGELADSVVLAFNKCTCASAAR